VTGVQTCALPIFKKLIVSATCELVVHIMNEQLTRAYDEETGLNLLTS